MPNEKDNVMGINKKSIALLMVPSISNLEINNFVQIIVKKPVINENTFAK
jgi:hypothetical protein